jgi:cysteinylglycine-S-conjugate dipeptidase
MTDVDLDAICDDANSQFESTVALLCQYLKTPAISCDASHFDDVRSLAAEIRTDLEKLGFDKALVRELDGALPLVTAEHCKAGPEKPTVLIYGHFDLQPVKGEPWDTPPHEAVRKGDRLYARGSADDMGGWVSHMAALKSWLKVQGELPLNVKLVIEGEEEIGSPNLERFMDTFPEAFAADAMVLTDCENPSTEIPGLTVSLRGLYEVELVCSALESDVHSGLWGNMAPDVSTALVKHLSRIVDDDGRLSIGRQEVPKEWVKRSKEVPLTDDVIRLGAHIRDGVAPLPARDRTPAEWVWRQPALTILSTTLPQAGDEKNALRAQASAVLSIRLAPGQTRDEMKAALEEAILAHPVGGVQVELRDRPAHAESWLYEPKGEAFVAAQRAYEKTWGHGLLQVGVGGSIPFVALFGRKYGDLPLILNGVMDPETGAHGPNESMHLGIFKKAIMANIHLLEELAKVGDAIRQSNK